MFGHSHSRQAQAELRNPLTAYPQPKFKEQPQAAPGLAQEMNPKPDHGEESYRGSGRLLGRRAVRVSDVGCAARESRRWGLIADLVQSAMCLACRLPDAQNLVRQQQLLGRIATHGAFQAAHPSFQADHPRLDPIHAGSHIAKLQREHARHAANRLDQRVHLSAESIDPFQR